MQKDYYRQNRERLINNIKNKYPSLFDTNPSVVLLKGSFYYPEYDADTYYCRVKYEENIQYLFGICWENVDALINIQDGKTRFIIPDIDLDSFFYSKQLDQKTAQDLYGVDRVINQQDLIEYLQSLNLNKILLYDGIDTYSKRRSNVYDNEAVLKVFNSKIDRDILYPLLNYQRCIKSKQEIARMQEAVGITCQAHIQCMKQCIPGMFEYQISGIFEKNFQKGAEDHAYSPICGANKNGSYLHYMLNNDILQNGQLILCDMGCKKEGVCSDITCTYPINGKFTEKQSIIYNIVLKAQRNGIDQLRPGLQYGQIQKEAYMIILQGLKDAQILQGNTEEMFYHNVHKIFMPHRLGHFIGYRTHDVGPPNLNGKNTEEKKQFLSVEQCTLEVGMALTVEPGIYFIDVLIEQSKHDIISSFFDYDVLEIYRQEIGGIRIEDDLVITQNGYLNLTNAPRTIEEIESTMALIKNNQIIIQFK